MKDIIYPSANILMSYPSENSISEIMNKNWSFLAVKDPRINHIKNGRYNGRFFYSSMELDGTFLDSNKVFSIVEEDVLNPNGTIKEFIIKNTSYIQIKSIKTIVIDTSNFTPTQSIIDNHTVVSYRLVEKISEFRNRRKNTIFNMKAKNVNTSISGSVVFLSQHYKTEILSYINDGTDDFKNKIISDFDNLNGTTDVLLLQHLTNNLQIGFDGVIGSTSGTVPLYYQDAQGNAITLKDIILQTINFWI